MTVVDRKRGATENAKQASGREFHAKRISEYLHYYYHERIHQGLHKIIQPQHEAHQGQIICIERLAGLLKSYHRKAA